MTTPAPAEGGNSSETSQSTTETTTPAPPADGQPKAEETDLDRWKRHSRFHEGQAEKHKKDLEQANDELRKLRESTQSDQEKALDQAKRDGQAEAEATWKARYIDTRRQSEATTVLNRAVLNPELMLPHLDLNAIEVTDDGTVDEGALAAAVDQLLTRFPDQARPTTQQQRSGGMDMHHRRTSQIGSGGSMESGNEMFQRRHGKTT